MPGSSSTPLPPSLSHAATSFPASSGAPTSTPICQPTMTLSDAAIFYSASNEHAKLSSPSAQISQRLFHPFLKTTPYKWESGELDYAFWEPEREYSPRRKLIKVESHSKYDRWDAESECGFESERGFDPEWWSKNRFPQFQKLPLELRLSIWQLAVPEAARVVLVKVRPTEDHPLHLEYLSIRPLNVCQEERQELLRCFRLEIQGHESVQISSFTTTDISIFNVSQDVACFESSTDLTHYLDRSRSVQALPFGLSQIQHMTIGEVVIRMPQCVPGSSKSDFGGLRRILGRAQVFPALKSLTIVRLCHPIKVGKTEKQKRHIAPHRLLNKEEAGIIIDHLNGLLWTRNRNDPRSAPTVKILSHGMKLNISPTIIRDPAELVELDQFIEEEDY